MRRINSRTHGHAAAPPRGLARIARLLLVATPFILALSTPTTHEARQDTGQNRARGVRDEAGATPNGRCPNISLCCHVSLNQGLLGPFIATLGGTNGVTPAFDWKLSAGRLVGGQGMKEILIDTEGLPKGRTILATVEVGGYGPRCSATCVVEIPDARGVDSRLATLSVSVKSSLDGRPVPRAKIKVYRDDGVVGGQAETDARGRFARGGWTPGAYRVEVNADRFGRQELRVTLDSSSAGSVALSLKPIPPPPTPSPRPSPKPTPSPTPTPSPSPTATPTPAPTPTPRPRWKIQIADIVYGPGRALLALSALAALAAAGYMFSNKMAAGAAGPADGDAAVPAEPTFGAAADTTRQADEVHCTVFAPTAARPGDMLKVQVFAHLEGQAEMLTGLAAERDEEARAGGSEALKGLIERGKELTFTLDMPGLQVKESERSLVWGGEPDSVRFTVTVPEGSKPKVVWGTVEILYESVPVGEVEFKFKVVADAAQEPAPVVAPPPAEQAEVMFTKAFISYSRKDSEMVLEKVQMLEAQGIQCYLDMMTFKPGEDWKQMINHYIDECDVFFLFWSNASKSSPEVDKEIRYALQRREKSAPRPVIKPIPIEGPPVVTPPPYLSHLHFDDRYRYFIKAKQVERLEASARAPELPAAT